jgi:glycosyltransferase involved in cell wall biosynthesis
VNVIPFPFDRIHPLSVFSFSSLIASIQPDIIHSHGRGAGLYCRVLSKKYIPCCRIHTHHGFHRPIDRFRRFVFTSLERFLSRNTDGVIAVSRSEKEEIQRTIPASTLVETIPNIVDCDDVRRRADTSSEHSREHFSVAMIGREDPVKNHPLAYTVADIVMQKDPSISFTFIGIDESNKGVTELRSKYPGRCDAAGLLENPLPLLQQKSVLLITSKREGAPVSILEAMALGKPVVGTNVRGINDLKTAETNGILLGDSAASIAGLILSLAHDKNLYASLSAAARQWSESQCNIPRWVGDYLTVYSKVLSSC